MELLHNQITTTLVGILFVTLNDAIGSVISRKLNFNYGFFTIGSVAIYCYVAYLVMKKTNYMTLVFLSVLLIALYDATVGWKISLKLKANFGQQGELMSKMPVEKRISGVVLFSLVCGWIGIFLARQ